MNMEGGGRGGPQVWSGRFRHLVEKRGFNVTSVLNSDWEAALFVISMEGMEKALRKGKTVAYRVASGYLPQWFKAMNRIMKPEHYASNAAISRALEIADMVIYQSLWAKNELDALLFPRSDRFIIIHNAVDLDKFSPLRLLNTNLPIIGTVGILRYRYRLETFLEMSRKLTIPHGLLIIGSMDDECTSIMRDAQEEPILKDRITYQPYVPQERLPDLYRQMSLLVHPVCGDVCPNVVIEALACGVPVVAPQYGGTAELVGEAGIIFKCQPWVYDQNFISTMTDATQRALSQVGALTTKARQRAEQNFDIERMVDRYLEALGLPLKTTIPLSQEKQSCWGKRLRQVGSRWISRPRFYAAVIIRKARQVQRTIIPHKSNTPPRVAFSLFDFHVGGIENWLYRLSNELKREFKFYFLATKVPEFLPKFQTVGTVAFLPTPPEFTRYIQEQHIDIVQVHNERWPVDAALAAGVPHVIERLGGQRSWRRVPKYGLERVIASSKMAIEAIRDMIPPERVNLVYNGIDLEEVDSSPKQRLFPLDTFVIGRTSRFGAGQNLHLLIEALKHLASNLPGLRLVLVGGDSLMPGAKPIENELRRLVSQIGLREKVYFTGLVENSLPYVQGFDAGTCVSNDEGIPNSLIEAMACRKPVISTRVGPITELVNDGVNGILIPPGDIEALCVAIVRLVNDPVLCKTLGEAGRHTIEKRFSIKQSAAQYAEIYRSLLRV